MPTPISFAAQGFETMDTTSGIESLAPFVNKPAFARLYRAQNARFSREGGVRTRNGFAKQYDMGLGAKVDDMDVQQMYDALFKKSSTKIQHTLDGLTPYDIGVTRTASERDFLFAFRKDIYAINLTDDSLRVACSTVAGVDDAGHILTVRTGDIDQFSASGTVYVRGIAITYSGVASSTLTGCSSLAGISVGDLITQTSTPAGFPKGSCMAEMEGSAIVGGGPDDPTALCWSEPSSPGSPELFYVFPVTYRKTLPSAITALKTGNKVMLIGMKKGMQYSTGFDVQTGVLLTFPLTDKGIPNARCIAQMDNEFAVLTNDGRILMAAETDAGFSILQNPDDPRTDMDYAVQGFIQNNMDRNVLDENHLHYDPATRELSATIRLNTGITAEFVFQRDIRAWSIDTGKNFSCKTIFKNRTYAGDDSDSFIHLDNEGWTDDGVAINVRLLTGMMRAARKGVTSDFLEHDFGGLLNPTGQFYMRVILGGSVVENKLYRASGDENLQEMMLMDVDTGIGIGGGQVGAHQIGSGGAVADAFRFDVPYEFGGEAEDAQIEWETTDEATIFELRYFDLSGETEGEILLTHT